MTDTLPLPSVRDILGRLEHSGDPARRRVVPGARTKVDLVISPNEVSLVHGTGVLLTRLLEQAPDFVLLRSANDWGGRNHVRPLADLVLDYRARGPHLRAEASRFTANALADYDVGFILCVPYYRSDVYMALAAKAATGAPLAVYVMDDNCLHNDEIPPAELADAPERRRRAVRDLGGNAHRLSERLSSQDPCAAAVGGRPSDPCRAGAAAAQRGRDDQGGPGRQCLVSGLAEQPGRRPPGHAAAGALVHQPRSCPLDHHAARGGARRPPGRPTRAVHPGDAGRCGRVGDGDRADKPIPAAGCRLCLQHRAAEPAVAHAVRRGGRRNTAPGPRQRRDGGGPVRAALRAGHDRAVRAGGRHGRGVADLRTGFPGEPPRPRSGTRWPIPFQRLL